MIGQVLSHYRVTAKLGEGGMGEVYRATDSRLGRDVAIKVLPAIYARDSDRMARFEREAQVLASLNHPNIAHIYGVEEANGTCALVMELVEGPTLAERLAAGAMPLEEALANAKSIAEALEYAHERGIVHRDLKPANVKIAADGRVKLLDFGLARALEDDPSATDISHSPTLTAEATKAGIILGTAAYMPPEQAKGKAVDRRADIWSFGAVLYEMLAGKQLFSGETSSETLAAVIKDQPDWSALPADIPAPITKLLRRCLTKDPKQRLRDIGEARIAIEEYLANPQAASEVMGGLGGAAPPTWRRALPWAIAGVLAVATAIGFVAYWRASQPEPHDVLQLSLVLPEPLSTNTSPTVGSTVALSPDGKSLVYMASPAGKPPQLFLRPLDQPVSTPIPGTENGAAPFFSPDGQWIGFFAEGKMLKVPVHGGPVSTVFGAASPRGASWAADDTITFVPTGGSGLMRVPAGGGTPRPLTTLNASEHEISHRWPDVLPGGKAVLFASSVAGRATWDDAEISLVSLETGQRRTLIHGGSFPRYVASGHIVYARTGVLIAVPFDLKRLEVTGPPVAVQEGVVTTLGNGAARFAVSESGLFAYVAGTAGEPARSLLWLDRKGTGKEIPAPPHGYTGVRLSPDGKLAAVSIGSGAGIPDIWVYDFARSTLTRLTFGPGPNSNPVWTPNSKRVIHLSLAGRASMRWKAADGSGADEELHIASDAGAPESVSPDGKTLLFSAINPDGGIGTQVLSLDGELKVRPLLASQFTQNHAQFSPDGHWIVYESNESTRNEIYVQPFPGPGGKWQISISGGTMPRWSRNGQEIFFRNGNQMMSVPVETRPAFKVGTPRLLFQGNYLGGSNYDVAPDGQHFLMIKEKEAQVGSKEVNVILNWFDDLKRRVPPAR